MIIDAEQMMGSVEAVVRTRSHSLSMYSESQVCLCLLFRLPFLPSLPVLIQSLMNLQLAWMVTVLDDDQGIWRWQAWNDASYLLIYILYICLFSIFVILVSYF